METGSPTERREIVRAPAQATEAEETPEKASQALPVTDSSSFNSALFELREKLAYLELCVLGQSLVGSLSSANPSPFCPHSQQSQQVQKLKSSSEVKLPGYGAGAPDPANEGLIGHPTGTDAQNVEAAPQVNVKFNGASRLPPIPLPQFDGSDFDRFCN